MRCFLLATWVQLKCVVWRIFTLHRPQSCDIRRDTTPHIPVGLFLNMKRSMRRCVYRKPFGKNGLLGFGERGRVGDLGGRGEGYVWICLRHLRSLFWYNRKTSEVTEWAKDLDIPKDECLTPTSHTEIRPSRYTSKARRKLKDGGFQRRRVKDREKSCEEPKDGRQETRAASPPAHCAHAHEDREGRITILRCLSPLAHPEMRRGTFESFVISWSNDEY